MFSGNDAYIFFKVGIQRAQIEPGLWIIIKMECAVYVHSLTTN